ncbi:MAG: 30S ribosomal protein S9 [Bacteroidales bacterium]
MEKINTIGRRKKAIARVYLSEGKGNIIVNNRELKEYFPVPSEQYIVQQPLKTLKVEGKYDIIINISGGGLKGQAEAARLSIARALVKVDSENKEKLKAERYLTRDARVVERKKPGQPKARKKTQFSKR